MLMKMFFTLDSSCCVIHQIMLTTVAPGHLKCLRVSFLGRSLDNSPVAFGSRINLDVRTIDWTSEALSFCT